MGPKMRLYKWDCAWQTENEEVLAFQMNGAWCYSFTGLKLADNNNETAFKEASGMCACTDRGVDVRWISGTECLVLE